MIISILLPHHSRKPGEPVRTGTSISLSPDGIGLFRINRTGSRRQLRVYEASFHSLRKSSFSQFVSGQAFMRKSHLQSGINRAQNGQMNPAARENLEPILRSTFYGYSRKARPLMERYVRYRLKMK
ncbi:hypothetical protein TNCV_3753121 [Trichonephila clavipes]|nr:hypothetical protein TNCV_3753121 [Trichonephila clavipes]